VSHKKRNPFVEPPSLDERRAAREESLRNLHSRFFERFGAEPQFAGRSVLEIGCGQGELAVYAAQAGASAVTAIDPDAVVVDYADATLASEYPQLVGRVRFEAVAVDQVSDRYDLVLSKDTFEHIFDPQAALRSIRERLNPGGEAWIGFSPLYFSPWGGHGHFGRLPWVQALPWPLARKFPERRYGRSVPSRETVWLNGMTPAQFRQYVNDAGLGIQRIAYNQGDKRGLGLLTRMRVGPLERFVTVSIYAILVRAA